MAKKRKNSVSTITAVAMAIVAYKNNNQSVIKDHVSSNKQLMLDMAKNNFVATEELLQQAEQICQSLTHQLIMTVLKDKNNSFLNNINTLLADNSVDINDFGLLAWVPKLHHGFVQNEQESLAIAEISYTSRYVGTVGKRIDVSVDVFKSIYLKNYNMFICTAKDADGNLFTFWHQKKLQGVLNICSRVKTHRRDERLNNAQVTVLNYVKVSPQIELQV
jgi:hypothetical protein